MATKKTASRRKAGSKGSRRKLKDLVVKKSAAVKGGLIRRVRKGGDPCEGGE